MFGQADDRKCVEDFVSDECAHFVPLALLGHDIQLILNLTPTVHFENRSVRGCRSIKSDLLSCSDCGSFEFFFVIASHHKTRSDDLKTFLLETAVAEQRGAEVADTDEHDRLEPVRAQQIGDHLRELVDVVAETAGAELPEVGEIFAQLRRFHARGPGERFAADRLEMVLPEPLEAAQIHREPVDGLARDLGAVGSFQAPRT